MKKTIILTALFLMAACPMANAQGYTTLGVGISPAVGTLHVHNSTVTHGGVVPLDPPDGDGMRLFDDHSQTTLHITNGITGTTLYDGFFVDYNDYNITLQQYEEGNLKLKNHNAEIILSYDGKVGVGAVNSNHLFNVEGKARVANNLTVGGNAAIANGLNINNGNIQLFANGKANFADEVRIGTGFLCKSNGELKVKSLRVTTTDWPDYVFGSSHRLMPLREVEDYINANGHLPEVPSAAEAEAEGVDLGEMNRLLLQKVEELTLYVIDLQKQLDELKSNKKK